MTGEQMPDNADFSKGQEAVIEKIARKVGYEIWALHHTERELELKNFRNVIDDDRESATKAMRIERASLEVAHTTNCEARREFPKFRFRIIVAVVAIAFLCIGMGLLQIPALAELVDLAK